MIENMQRLDAEEKFLGVWIRDEKDASSSSHNAYEIAIHTSHRTIIVTGCHDSGPDVEVCCSFPVHPNGSMISQAAFQDLGLEPKKDRLDHDK